MKKYAYYLPQFHTICENDEWWGEGFTEWTNVKSAKPLKKGHVQPIHPLNDYYYNLLDKEVVEWQTELMKKYRIDGMIYYHYHFCGKYLLEKPAENLLKWKDINQKFFFCWANHSWKKSQNGVTEILIEQKYGESDVWREHFEYLLPFFQDDRYEKIDGMPLFVIYDSNFEERNEMMRLFNTWCIEAGFRGIYVIETCHGGWEFKKNGNKMDLSEFTRKVVLRNPNMARYYFANGFKEKYYRITKKIDGLLGNRKFWVYSGDDFYKGIQKEPRGNLYIPSIFCGWDNTPRHGRKGHIITHPSKKVFMETLNALKDEEYLVINAWNEWAEGMIMEPTVEYGYMYLEWIKEWTELNE